MNLKAISRGVVRRARAHPVATRYVVGVPLAWAAVCFALGYRLPFFDRHPSWPEFPGLTNPRLVVEPLPNFEEEYGHRFPFVLARQSVQQWHFQDVYRTNLRNVRSLGTRITGNDFVSGISINTNLNLGGGNDVGRQVPTTFLVRCDNEGYEYLELHLGTEAGRFKEPFYNHRYLPLTKFYQYNQPRSLRDTLYFRYDHTDWRLVYR
jgi:hypothetical protein